MAFENEDIFPKEFGCEIFEAPTFTNFNKAVKSLLQLADSVKLRVKDMNYSEKLILLTIEKTSADG